MMTHHPTKFGSKRFSISEDMVWINIHWHFEVSVTLTLNRAIQFLHKTLWLMIMYHQIAQHSSSWCCITMPSLVTKCSAVQKVSSRHIFIDILNLCCNLDLESSNQTFTQDTPAYDAVPSDQVWLQMACSSEDIVETVIFWLHKPLLWPWPWR